MTDRGYVAIDYSGVVFLVLAALCFAWAWYKRAFGFSFSRQEDEVASRALLAASESRLASRSVSEERNLSPAGQRVALTVFLIMTGLMALSPIVTYLVAKRSFDHVSHGYTYPSPTSGATPRGS